MSTLVDEINARVSDTRTRIALLLGALLEGGSLTGPWNAGDSGTSFGPYQIHLPAHPDFNAQTASDPKTALNWAIPAYSAAVRQVPDSLWQSNPQQAAATAAYIAERPAYMYPASRVSSAWSELMGAGASQAPTGGSSGVTPVGFGIPVIPNWPFSFSLPPWLFPPGQGTNPGVPGIGVINWASNVLRLISDPHFWALIGLTIGAAVLIVVGAIIFAKPKPPAIMPIPV